MALVDTQTGASPGRWFIALKRSAKRLAIAISLASLCESSSGQSTTFTYDPTVSGSNVWTNSAKWGLPSGYPNEDGTVINLRRVASATTLNLGITSVTVGKINGGSAGTGTGQWSIGSSGGVITLDNSIWGEGVFPAELNALNGALRIDAQMMAEKGVSISGGYTTQIYHPNTVLRGGITVMGSGGAYFGHAGSVNQSTINIQGSGGLRFGNATASDLEISSDFVTGSVNAGIGTNITNGSTMTVSGNITGTGGIRLFSENTARNDVTELTGQNDYLGTTIIRTNVKFHELRNFGDGAISFDTTARTLTYASGNEADITQTVAGLTRSVTFGVDTTIDTADNNVTYRYSIVGAGRLIKTGQNSLTLLAENGFQGVSVQEGSLTVGDDSATGGNSKSLVLGNGTSLEIMENTGLEVLNLSLASLNQISFTLNPMASDATHIAVFGDQTGDGTYIVDIPNSYSLFSGEYTLLSVAGNAAASSFALASGTAGELHWDQNAGVLTYTAVPEPSAQVLVILAGGLGMIFRRRLKRDLKGLRKGEATFDQ